MGRINWGRVSLGGLAAGVVINISEFLFHAVVFKDQEAETLRALGKDPAAVMTGSAVVIWNILGFFVGIAAVWLYAAIRPRFGPGPKTAVTAGIAVWFLAHFVGALAEMNMGLFPQSQIMTGLVWGLVEVVIATLVGAWLYKEA
jgi:hypothetical protein